MIRGLPATVRSCAVLAVRKPRYVSPLPAEATPGIFSCGASLLEGANAVVETRVVQSGRQFLGTILRRVQACTSVIS